MGGWGSQDDGQGGPILERRQVGGDKGPGSRSQESSRSSSRYGDAARVVAAAPLRLQGVDLAGLCGGKIGCLSQSTGQHGKH
jgi:hypothetical protein